MNRTNIIIAIVVGLIAICGTVVKVNTHFAHASDMMVLEQRLETKIVKDRSYELQKREWEIQDRLVRVQSKSKTAPFMPSSDERILVDQLRQNEFEKNIVDKQLDILLKEERVSQ